MVADFLIITTFAEVGEKRTRKYNFELWLYSEINSLHVSYKLK
jgi:hypothetical protein